MKKKNFKKIAFRIFATAIMAIIIFMFVILTMFITKRLHVENGQNVSRGEIKIKEGMLAETPVYLNGEWEALDGFLTETEEAAAGLPGIDNYRSFPIGSINEAKKDATYRIRISSVKRSETSLYLAIPTFEGELDIYVNGEKKDSISSGGSWIKSAALELLIPLDNWDSEKEWQEIVISGDFSNRDITLFRRPIVLGTRSNLSTLVLMDGFMEMFAFGLLILAIINGCVFMLFRPEHDVISIITVFDAVILARIFFSLKFTIGFIKTIFPTFIVTDTYARSAELFFLMIGGIVGCMLSHLLYDPKGKVPRCLTWTAPIAYAVFGIFFPFNMHLFERFGSKLLLILYAYTFAVVFMEVSTCWRVGKQRKYYTLQFLRTCYIGTVVLADIIFWAKYKDFSVLLYAYVGFFILHVLVRLYDNNLSYQHVEDLNYSLEATVEERTEELSRANKVLSELSIRDPLTNIFNRLYFEGTMEEMLEKQKKESGGLHLCMFDLDFFKQVNDTYGHHVGDEVLKRAAELVGETVGEDVVLARIGGEEFVLLFQGYDDKAVMEMVDGVRLKLEHNAKDNPEHTTASFGIAAWSAEATQKTLLKAADSALYEAKNKGRNCVVFSR